MLVFSFTMFVWSPHEYHAVLSGLASINKGSLEQTGRFPWGLLPQHSCAISQDHIFSLGGQHLRIKSIARDRSLDMPPLLTEALFRRRLLELVPGLVHEPLYLIIHHVKLVNLRERCWNT